MNAASRRNNNSNGVSTASRGIAPERTARKLFLPTLMAIGGGCSLLSGAASALELGELQVHSTLGQPLRASVAYALQPNEQIHSYCIYLRPGASESGLPTISNAAIRVADNTISVTGRTAIKEPLLSLKLTVDCPYAAHLRRDYSVFLDPALPAAARSALTPRPAPQAATAAVASDSAPQRRTDRPAGASPAPIRTPVISSSSYAVQAGDTLSTIAAGIAGRNVGIWQAVDVLFAANPGAFINGDMNLLRAGAVLAIPDSIVAPQSPASSYAASGTRAQPDTQTPAPATATAESPTVPAATRAAEPARVDTRVSSSVPVPAASPAVPRTDAAAGRSGSPFVSPDVATGAEAAPAGLSGTFAAPTEVIPPTPVQDAASPRPSITVPAGTGNDSWSWLAWLGGSGVALIVALLLFGRRLKGRFAPASLQEPLDRRRTDSKDLDDTDVSPVLGLPAEGTAPVAKLLSLDADLEDGVGLRYGDEMDVAQDFGFSDSGSFDSDLDMDLTGAASEDVPDRTTNIIPPQRMQEGSIVVSETPPRHDDTGEYEVSMIVDVTRQALGETDETTKDLRAIQVDAGNDAAGEDDDTLSQAVDYKILEQDYEEELTATQALNADIAKAARALSRQFGKNEMGDTLADDAADDGTVRLSGADADETPNDDATAAMPGAEAEDESGEETAQMPAQAPALSLDDTANDPTVEVESGTAGKRKASAS